jgi:hypothetical protein
LKVYDGASGSWSYSAQMTSSQALTTLLDARVHYRPASFSDVDMGLVRVEGQALGRLPERVLLRRIVGNLLPFLPTWALGMERGAQGLTDRFAAGSRNVPKYLATSKRGIGGLARTLLRASRRANSSPRREPSDPRCFARRPGPRESPRTNSRKATSPEQLLN